LRDPPSVRANLECQRDKRTGDDEGSDGVEPQHGSFIPPPRQPCPYLSASCQALTVVVDERRDQARDLLGVGVRSPVPGVEVDPAEVCDVTMEVAVELGG